MKKESYIKEKEIVNQPQAIDTEEMSNLLDLMKTHICKINCKDGSHGTGFFCNILNDWNNIIKVLMTNNHVLNKTDIQPGQTINFSINNDDKEYNILMDNERIIYTNELYDVTIIEIKIDDKIGEKSFFDLDERIFEENFNKTFKNSQIFLLHYPKGAKMKISPGIIKNIIEDEEKKTIYHLCDTTGGSSGGPIINKNNFKVIGIHKGASDSGKNYNLGTLLKEPVEKFKEKNKEMGKYIKNNSKNIYIKDKGKNEEKKEINNEEKEKIEKNGIIQNNNNIEKSNEINDEKSDEIIIQYKIDSIKYSKDMKIFGEGFVKKNKNKCKIIVNGSEFELSSDLNVNINQLKNNLFEIKLKGINNITNMDGMFWNCFSLYALPDISKWDTKNVTDMGSMFSNCESLSFLPDISKWNTQNVTGMFYMFENCKSLSLLPDISKWDTKNVTSMSNMFEHCESLSFLPDISKWHTQNVISLSSLFRYCKSLSSIPDISK